MEEKKGIFSTLNMIDFEELINIPRPVLNVFEVFRQCFAEQSRRVSDLYVELNKITEKVQFKLRSLNEVIANTNESIQNQQENILRKVKERCEFLKNDVNTLRVKITEENNSKQKIMNESLYEMKEKIDKCIKIVNSAMTPEDVTKAIADKSTSLHITICNEIRDNILKPSNEKIMTELKLVKDKNQKTVESLNLSIKNIEKQLIQESTNLVENFHNLQLEQTSQNKICVQNFKEFQKEIEETNKKIEFYQFRINEIEKNFNFGQGKNNKEFSVFNEKLQKVIEKIENFENLQKTFHRTAISSKTLKAPKIQKEITLPELPNFSLIIETEIIKAKKELEASLINTKKDLLSYFNDHLQILEGKWNKSKISLEEATCEIKDKLAWLPINLNELKGMAPSDARLFTVEARLRAEENSRIQAISSIEKSLQTIRKPRISHINFKSPDRRATPDLRHSIDRLLFLK